MPGLFASAPWILAQIAAPPAGGAAGPANPWAGIMQFAPFVVVIVLWFYLLLIRPQQMQDKKRREMMNAIKKNDRVITTTGMYGTVVSVDENQDRVTLRIDDDKGVRAVFTKASIVRIIDSADGKEKSPKEKAAESV